MAKYQVLAEALRQKIIEGILSPGNKLPSEYELQKKFQVSRQTVRNALEVLEKQGFIRFTVQDEGMGIPPDSIPHIFERFYRTDQSRDRKTGGTGLGLSIAKWIVERHGGWFEVVSRPSVGTRITVILPAPQKEEATP